MGRYLTDEQLSVLGVTRKRDEFGKLLYSVPCVICGCATTTRNFSTERVYKCRMCKGDAAERRKARAKAAREEHERIIADEIGTDSAHVRRFENGAAKFGRAYRHNIETAHKAIDEFDSVPEVVACIELLHIGTKVIVHQKVGDFTVDFCLPEEKVVVEIDGSLYHNDEAKEQMRDYAISYMLGDGWVVRHVPADAVMKKHSVFGRTMKRMLNERREELGIERLS